MYITTILLMNNFIASWSRKICILISMADDDSTEGRFDDLDDFICYLETEKDPLKKSVEHAAAQWDFSEAKTFAKSE